MTTTVASETLLENLASYVPHLVMRAIAANPVPLSEPVEQRFPAAVLFADISGFTRLTERLARRGPEGVENLSNLLNTYFGQLIDIILEHGGDIVEFTGDGLIVLWPSRPAAELSSAVLLAAACGLAVQQELAHFADADGLHLALRVSIGAGEVFMACVGGILGRWELVVAGDPVLQVGAASSAARPGDVILTAAAWELARPHSLGEPLEEDGALLRDMLTPVPVTLAEPLPLKQQMIAAMASFLPGAILDRLEAGQSDWLAELRYVTIIFVNVCDLNYNTPDALRQLHEVMRALQSGLYQYEGSVNQFIVDDKGTTFVAAMGLPPLTHEDDAIRGVQAALAMHTRLRALNISCAIGVTTGWVFSGARGNARRRDYAMIGDTINLAARLMQAAQKLDHGSAAPVLCDAATYEAAQSSLNFEPLPALSVKGKTQPIVVYRPRGRERRPRNQTSRMIGRATESAVLEERLTRVQRGEHAGVVIVEGETGIGKSRLINDMEQRAAEQGITCLMGTGDAIEHTSSYHAWRPIFTRVFNLDTVTSDEQLARRIRVLNRLWLYPEMARHAPLMNAVLPLDIPENQLTAHMSGQVRATNTRNLLLRVLQSVVSETPTVLVLDEAHWLDSASWALALLVAQRLQPALLIIATRPLAEPLPLEYRQLLQMNTTQRIELNSLAPTETLELVCERLGVASLPEQVAQIVLDKAQGNPFFSEELVYAMRDTGLIVIEDGTCRIAPNAGDLSAISFPGSVQGVVISRIDRLQPTQQLTLKVASVIGQIFALRTLHAVYPLEPDKPRLPDYLRTLEKLNITSLATPEPDLSYIFKNIIIQEVVYNLLLFSQRRELHRAVAEWYEATYPEDLSAYYPLLAHHWLKAEVQPRAMDYLEQAGERALHVYANHEAVRFFSELLAMVDPAHADNGNTPTAPDVPMLRQAQWHRRLGTAYLGLGNLAESRLHLEQSVALLDYPLPTSRRKLTTRTTRQVARQMWHRFRAAYGARSSPEERAAMLEAARAYESLLVIYFFANETLPSIYASLLTLNLAERAGISAELARAYGNMCIATGTLTLHPLADSYGEQALATADQVGDMPTRAYVRNIVGLYRVGVGKWREARLVLEEAVDICDQLGDRRNWGTNWTLLAQVAYYEGDFPRAAEMFGELADDAQRSGDVLQQAWALGGQGQNLLRLGHLDAACEFLQRANDALAANEELPSQISNSGLLAICWLRQGDLQRAAQAMQTANDLLAAIPVPSAYYLIEGYAGCAETALALWEASSGQPPARRAQLRRQASQTSAALERFARTFALGLPRMWLCRGLLFWLSGKASKAYLAWNNGLEISCRLDMPYEAALLYYEIGRHRTGRWRRTYLEQAVALFRRLGAMHDVQRSEALLNR